MTELWLVGIGTGHPEHLTLEGQRALREASAVLLPRKGTGKEDLAHLRLAMLEAANTDAMVLSFEMPVRDETLPYLERVEAWHDEIAKCWQNTLENAPEGPVAVLVWGDPSLYDSTLRIAARLSPSPRLRVVPGITALQALTAAHAIPFNTVNGSVIVTTGRRLREYGWPEGAATVVVMLDGQCSFQTLLADQFDIWWGAFLGMPEQILEHGPLAEATPRILSARKAARQRHGWIMDTYLLRQRTREDPSQHTTPAQLD